MLGKLEERIGVLENRLNEAQDKIDEMLEWMRTHPNTDNGY